VAPAQSKRQSRKRRKPSPAGGGQPASRGPSTAPVAESIARTSAGTRREARAERQILAEREERRRQSMLGAYGERPPSLFGGVPVSEIAIFVGALGAAVGFFGHNNPALIVGLTVCALGVAEFTAREHFSGYRSHATLLAAMPAVAIVVVAVAVFGAPADRTARILLLVAIVPVFAVLYWALRKRFRTARQARIVRPPGA
jgi:hypothetical protein